MKSVRILGSTGSVGTATVDLIRANPNDYTVEVLTAASRVDDLIRQARDLKPKLAVIANDDHYSALRDGLSGTGIEVASGHAALLDAASRPAEWTMAAIVGMAGLKPLMNALSSSSVVAIANKEPLVAAGPFVLATARRYGTTVLPVDSEHNAIFQVFEDRNRESVERLILTASGGPFREWPLEKMEKATRAEAVAHPNWSMGAKISVDSATMMNKALEVIEAHYLFNLAPNKIDVLIHPQSIIHSMVEYVDGSVLAQLGAPDMRTPISYTLAWPGRMPTTGQKLDWTKLKHLDFSPPDDNRFPLLPLAYECLANGPAHSIAFNAANEVAVEAFLAGRIGFMDIQRMIMKSLEKQTVTEASTLDDVIMIDKSVRERTKSYIV